ncbi:MAG TPA: enoyl-CoA hydratase-related protein [Burkholderiaceae bacterium]|nr:enoyl-CoA hydratase-related protein [Burkholderiaceae bacterium]
MTMHLQIADGLATIVFDNPGSFNVMSIDQLTAFGQATEQLAADPGVRVVVLRAEGPIFGGGGDIASFRLGADDAPDQLRAIGRVLNPAILRLRALPAIVVAAVHGAVAGGSVGMMSAADLVIAAQGTKFNLAYARIGASPDVGNSWFLPRLVGARKALEWLLLSDDFDADTALAHGLVNQVVPAAQLRAAADQLVARLLAGPHGSQARMKRLIYQSESTPLAQQLYDEIEHFAQATATPDFVEGVTAFLQKRAPHFGQK